MDTIMNNLPAPPIFLHKTLDDNGKATFHVVDGKQRIQTIIDFRGNKVRLPDNFSDINLRKKKWDDLNKSQRDSFWNYEMLVEQIPDVSEPSIRNIFERINRNSRKLTAQELRHAKYDGWFINFAEREAEDVIWRDFGITTRARAKRMADVQFISELMAVCITREMREFDQDAMDDMYAAYEDIEENPAFSLEDFEDNFQSAKKYISDMIDHNQEMASWTKVQAHFYSLWGYASIFEIKPAPSDAADYYINFMRQVSATLDSFKEDGPDNVSSYSEDDSQPSAWRYTINLRGANTEFPQRKARYNELVKLFSHSAENKNEN